MSVTQPGIHRIPEAVYHADPCPGPSLSAGAAHTLLTRSPLHCWHEHPRLNTMREPEEPSDTQDYGTIIHELFLGEGRGVVEIDADDWRTKAAKEARAAARAAGQIPVLAYRMAQLQRCAEAARDQVRAYPEIVCAMEHGQAEATFIWREGEAWCRARPDWLPDDPALPMLNLKTTGRSAAPESIERTVVNDWAFSAAFYARGERAVRGGNSDTLFVCIEQEPPYVLSVMAVAPSLDALAHERVDEALALWRECLRTDRWPGYPPHIGYVEAPGWMQTRQEERKLRAEWSQRERRSGVDLGALSLRIHGLSGAAE